MENIFNLSGLCAAERFARKRLGRGIGSAKGKTAGKGHKGAKARSGCVSSPFFEGGQMPIYRRLPKRGFKSRFDRSAIAEVSLNLLQELIDCGKLNPSEEVNIELLKKLGAVRKNKTVLRILGGVEISTALSIKSNYITKSAKEILDKVGSKVEVL